MTAIAPRRRTTILRGAAAAALAATVALAATACGEEEPEGSGGGTTTVEVVFEDGDATVNGDTPGATVEVAAGETVELEVTADQAGEIHVHSDPEHSIEYAEGTDTYSFAIDRPGRVEVEAHDPDLLLFQLEVR